MPLIAWAKKAVLTTLNTPSTRSTLHDGLHSSEEGPHKALKSELSALLSRTVDGIENVSTLLVGPRGAGKHRMLSAALRGLRQQDGCGFLRVDLHPMLVPDEPTALMFIANQLRVMHSNLSTKGSFCDALRYLLHLMRRARPGGHGDDAVEGQSQPVVFVLHSFEQFTLRPKQTLLYSLFDLMQTEDAQMAVVGITTRVDVADLLEKRVRSRCSQRQMWIPALETPSQCATFFTAALALPDVPPGTSPVPEATPEQAKRFRAAWCAQAECINASLEFNATLRRRLSMGVSPKQLDVALRLALSELSASKKERSLITMEGIEGALKYMMVPREEIIISECSAVELLLLLCLKKLSDKELPPPHTLRMALREYSVFVQSGQGTQKYDYPKALLTKAFEHLCSMGLVSVVNAPGHRGMGNDELPLRITVDPQALLDFVKSHPELPTEVHRFGTQMTL